MSSINKTDIGRLAYDKQSRPPVMCCIVVVHQKEARDVCINEQEDISVSDCYYECDDDENVYSVAYLETEETKKCDKSRDEILEMERAERHAYLYSSDLNIIAIPSSQIRIRN